MTDDLAVLRAEDSADDGRRADPLRLRGIEHTVVTAIEACVDVAQHVCVTQGWGPPRDDGDAMAVLGAHGVLPPDLASRLRRAVGSRDVDDRVVVDRLADPSDLASFVAAVTDWLGRGDG